MNSQPSDLRSCKLRLAGRHARVLRHDGTARDVEGAEFDGLIKAAAPILEALARPEAKLRALSIDFAKRVLRATFDVRGRVEPLRIDNDEFERTIAPLCADLIAAAGS